MQGHDEWHLPTFDPHNENKYHYPLHSLDIYFWTQQDALQFVNGIRRVLPPGQCEVVDEPGPPPRHSDEVSSIVQKLEKAAVSEDSRTNKANGIGGLNFAPPPLSAVSGTPEAASQPPFVPMAYNPAAPAAPEQIRHREKTPPPPDASVSPLHQTLTNDAGTPFSPGLAPSGLGPLSPAFTPQYSQPAGAPLFPGPPSSVASPGLPPQGFGHPAGLAQHPGMVRSATMPVHSMQNTYGATFPGALGALHTPTPPLASPGLPPPPHAQHPPPAYNPAAPIQANEYDIHSQFYTPENGTPLNYKPKQEVKGKLEEGAGRLERGVTGMLKKLEKKFG